MNTIKVQLMVDGNSSNRSVTKQKITNENHIFVICKKKNKNDSVQNTRALLRLSKSIYQVLRAQLDIGWKRCINIGLLERRKK